MRNEYQILKHDPFYRFPAAWFLRVQLKEAAKMKTYQERKEAARDKAVEWSLTFSEKSLTWGELAAAQEYFYKLAVRYGLVREFRENAII